MFKTGKAVTVTDTPSDGAGRETSGAAVRGKTVVSNVRPTCLISGRGAENVILKLSPSLMSEVEIFIVTGVSTLTGRGDLISKDASAPSGRTTVTIDIPESFGGKTTAGRTVPTGNAASSGDGVMTRTVDAAGKKAVVTGF